MPYRNDPRRRITLNFHPADYDALAADAARAGHASAYAYVMALVQARGAALRPVVDEHGAQRVARLKTKLAAAQVVLDAAQQAVAKCRAARGADAERRRALEQELATRPGRAEVQQLLDAAVARAVAERVAATPPTPSAEEAARAARRAARRGEG
jgi:hypothetical protein